MIQQTRSRAKVLVVDDHTLFSEGTIALLSSETELEVVGIAKNGNECLTLVNEKKPDVILLDISLPDILGIHLIDQIKRVHSEARVIMLTGHDPRGYITISLQKGAQGFLLKNCTKKEMVEAISYVSKEKVYFSLGMAPFLKNVLVGKNHNLEALSLGPKENDKLLTPRETEIMNLVSKGLGNNEIALTLGLKSRTVNFHVGNILIKLDVNSRLKAVVVWKSAVEEKITIR
jgi:DNA-binding NarL/FixJ family response regulator